MELLKKNESYQKVIKYTDLSFDINGFLIPVNKCLLALKSDYFDKLFSYNQGEIIKLNFELNAFIHVISFLYSGKIDEMSQKTLIDCIAILNELLLDKNNHIEKYILSCNNLEEISKIDLYLDDCLVNLETRNKVVFLLKRDGVPDNIDILFPLMDIRELLKFVSFNRIEQEHIKYFSRNRTRNFYPIFLEFIFEHWTKNLNDYDLLELLLRQITPKDGIDLFEDYVDSDGNKYLRFNILDYRNPKFNSAGYYLQLPIQEKNLYYIKDDVMEKCVKLRKYNKTRVNHKVYELIFNDKVIEDEDLLNLYYLYAAS